MNPNTNPNQFETINLGIGTVEVRFLRGVQAGESGWWCIRTGKDFDYNEIGFVQFVTRAIDKARWVPGPAQAANAVHLYFNPSTGEGLSIRDATKENVELLDSFGRDGLLYRVIAKRSVTQRPRAGEPH